MPLAEAYAREIRRELGMWVTFPPRVVSLGDYGEIVGGAFVHKGNIQDLGVEIEDRPAGPAEQIEYKSTGEVEVAGAISAPAATMKVTFSEAGSVLLSAANCGYRLVGNPQSVEAGLIALRRAGAWRSWVVVTGLVAAESTTLLVASGENASIELSLTEGTLQSLLAGAGAKLKVSGETNIGYRQLCLRNAAPLLTLSKIARRWYQPWLPKTLRQLSAGAPGDAAEAASEELALVVVEDEHASES